MRWREGSDDERGAERREEGKCLCLCRERCKGWRCEGVRKSMSGKVVVKKEGV